MQNKKKKLLAGLLVLILLAGISLALLTPGNLNKAPEVVFNTLEGERIDLQNLQGQPVLITFWATTCSGCIKEMPHLISIYNEFSDQGFEIIAVAMTYDPPNQVVEMSRERNIPYPIALDVDGTISRQFGDVILTPTSFLIAPDGSIVMHKTGEMKIDELRDQIFNLLSREKLSFNYKPLVANKSIL